MSRDTPSGFTFDYDRAFSRNIGWVTRDEQQRLRRARVAVAGLGGVGGAHVLTLSRLGIANFNIADFDEFDVHNLNRQAAAFMSSMGRPKIEVVAEMARDINPESDIRLFRDGVTDANLDEFLKDVDALSEAIRNVWNDPALFIKTILSMQVTPCLPFQSRAGSGPISRTSLPPFFIFSKGIKG